MSLHGGVIPAWMRVQCTQQTQGRETDLKRKMPALNELTPQSWTGLG